MSPPLSSDSIGLMTIREAARHFRVREGTVRTWVRRYQLGATRVRGQVMVSERDLMACERRLRCEPYVPTRDTDGKFVTEVGTGS